MSNNKNIIFFDGVCNLCNGFVNFVIHNDHKAQFLFSPLQSEYAKANISPELLFIDTSKPYKSVVLKNSNNIISDKSCAVLNILKLLRFPWNIVGYTMQMIPQFFRDSIYMLIANNRYRLFGQTSKCRLPTDEEKKYFL